MPKPGHLAVVLAVLGLSGAGAARAAPPARIAFLGLRPTEAASFSGTAIAQLPEAQRLRAVAENVTEMLSGATVLRHEELRAALGPTYLAELFDCEGNAACLLRVASALARKGVQGAMAGDYFASGDALRIRLRRFDLVKGRLTDERTLVLPRVDVESLAPWRGALQPLFQDTGRIRVLTNVRDFTVTLDGTPQTPSADGVIASVPEGEHVIELAREGYRRSHRVVTVRRGEELRVALPLEELPIQAQKAPDPTARVPTFERPGETTRIAPFGLLRLALGWDNVNGGDREDPLALPRVGAVREGGFVVLPRPAVAGITVQAPGKPDDWQLRGALSTAWVKDAGPEMDSAFAELVKEDAGFRMMIGLGQGIVSSLTAGTLTLPEGFGDLAAGLVGLTVSQSLGPFVLEAFVGRHKAQFSPEADPAGASPGPFGAVHVAFVSERLVGRLYGEDYPLTVGVSGVFGEERVGLSDEQAWAEALGVAQPVLEEVRVWAASVEAHVPFGRVASVAGEAYVGEDVHLLEGALWQRPRVNPETGRHAALRSAGGWGQLSVNPTGSLELRALVGTDRILRGLDQGLAAGGEASARRNSLAAVNAVWYALDHLAIGAQVHAIRTWHEDRSLGRATLVGAVVTSQLTF